MLAFQQHAIHLTHSLTSWASVIFSLFCGAEVETVLHLQTGQNISVIMESEIVWEKFWAETGLLAPYPVHFSDYSKGKLFGLIIV